MKIESLKSFILRLMILVMKSGKLKFILMEQLDMPLMKERWERLYWQIR
jgi:hypothetical protein